MCHSFSWNLHVCSELLTTGTCMSTAFGLKRSKGKLAKSSQGGFVTAPLCLIQSYLHMSMVHIKGSCTAMSFLPGNCILEESYFAAA